jgi:hypothetical protein
MPHIYRGYSADDRWNADDRPPGCEPLDALEALAFFHESFPGTLAEIVGRARELLALAERLDAAGVQAGDAVLLRLHLHRLEEWAWRAEDEVQAFYGSTPAPRRGAAP